MLSEALGCRQRELQQHLRCVRELAVPLGQHCLCGVSASDADKEIAAVGSGGQLLVLSMEELAAEEEQPVRTLLLPQDPVRPCTVPLSSCCHTVQPRLSRWPCDVVALLPVVRCNAAVHDHVVLKVHSKVTALTALRWNVCC